MTYNNLETQVTSTSGTWSGPAISFSTLGLSTSIPYKDQIEVERIFSSEDFNAVKDTITPKDLHKIFLLQKTEYDITGNTVSGFSGLTGSRVYTLTDGTGRTVTIPAISNGDSVIIRRKTLSIDSYVTWAPGTKLTTTQLNQQVSQLLRLNQELIYKLDTEYVRAADLTGTTAPVTSLNNSLNMNSYTINNLGNFSSIVGDGNNSYAVNKGYVDTNFVNKSTAQTGIAGAKTFTGAMTLSSGLTVDTNTLVVDATNDRVGIGTASPNQKLHVIGNTKIQGGTAGDTQSTITNMSGLFVEGGIGGTSTSSVAYSSGGGGGAAISFKRDNSYGTYIDFSTNPTSTATSGATTTRMTIDHTGNVGIGTTGPSVKLQVNTTTANDGLAILNSSNQKFLQLSLNTGYGSYNPLVSENDRLIFWGSNAQGAAGDSTGLVLAPWSSTAIGLKIASSGNVGIGSSSPSTRLQIAVPSTGTTLTGTDKYCGIHLSQNNANNEFTGITSAFNNNGTQGGILFQSAGTYGTKLHFLTTDAFVTGMQNRMTLNHFGNLGIGGESTGTKLEVITTGTGTNGINIRNSATGAYGSLHIQGTSGGVNSWANGFVIEGVPYSTGNTILSSYTGSLKFQTGTDRTERMAIDSSGRVGIGTNNPDVKLHVVGGGGVIAKLQATNVTQTMGYIGAGDDIAYTGTLSNHPYGLITNNSQRVIITADGNVGIGTGSPSNKFVVSNSNAEGFEVAPGASSNSTVLLSYNRTASNYNKMDIRASDFSVGIGSDEKITMAANGEVKIKSAISATSTTSGSLQVTGGVGISGALYANSTAVGGAASGTPIIIGTASSVGIYVTSAAPTFAAAKGSLCINTGGGASTLLYVCKTANTATAAAWSAVTSS